MGRNLRWTAGVVAVITLAACGSSATRSERSSKVDISTWRAGTESGTARIAGRSTTVTDGEPDQVEITEGAVDFDRRRYTSKSRVTSGPRAGREFETRQIDDTMYWWDPSPDGPGTTAKPWSRAEIPWQAGAWKTTLDRAFADPDATVTATGTETVRGAEVTNYRIDYAPHIPPRLLARGYPKGLTDLEIAVDGDQRIRRVRYSVHTTKGSVTHEELELYDEGAPVTVEAPPADQIDTSGTSASRPVATGPWTDLVTDGDGAERVVVSAVPTQDGTCFAAIGTGREPDGWWTVAGRATDRCMTSTPEMLEMQVEVRPIRTDLQILTGQFDRDTTAVTLRLDDGSTRTIKPTGGAFAAIVRGDRVVERVEATGPIGPQTCDFKPDFAPFVYSCGGATRSPAAFPTDPLPFDPTAPPTTTPGG